MEPIKFSVEQDGLTVDIQIPQVQVLQYLVPGTREYAGDKCYAIGHGVQRNALKLERGRPSVDHGELYSIMGGDKNFNGDYYAVVDWGVNGACKCEPPDACNCIDVIMMQRYLPFPKKCSFFPHTPSTMPSKSRDLPAESIHQVMAEFVIRKGWVSKYIPDPDKAKCKQEKKETSTPARRSSRAASKPLEPQVEEKTAGESSGDDTVPKPKPTPRGKGARQQGSKKRKASPNQSGSSRKGRQKSSKNAGTSARASDETDPLQELRNQFQNFRDTLPAVVAAAIKHDRREPTAVAAPPQDAIQSLLRMAVINGITHAATEAAKTGGNQVDLVQLADKLMKD